MMTPETYRAYFQKLREFTEFLKTFLNERRSKIPMPPPEMEAERQAYLKLFSGPKAASACIPCGQCCYQGGSPLTMNHLVRLILENPNFTLPMPDFEFLSQNTCKPYRRGTNHAHEGYKCVFLGKAGCLLKESRPRICYRYACLTLKDTMGREMAKTEEKSAYEYYQWTKKMLADLVGEMQSAKMPASEFQEALRDCLDIEGMGSWIAGPLGFDRAFRHEEDLCPTCQKRRKNTAFHND